MKYAISANGRDEAAPARRATSGVRSRGRLASILALLALAALAAVVIGLFVGSVTLAPDRVWAVLVGHGDPLATTLVLDLRLPRVALAFATGALLALAGTLMQVLLRNPLADPYILGVSGGAAVGALITLLLGLGVFWLEGAAFAGALASTLIVFALAHGRGGWTSMRLLLTGVVVAAGWGAAIGLLLAMSDDTSLRSMLFWLMGDLSYQHGGWGPLVLAGFALAVSLPFARHLNVLARGEMQAQALGVPVGMLTIGIYVVASLLTAVAVTEAGAIGFVGLVIPHMLRLAGGSDHRLILPGSALAGGSLLVLADTLARTVLAPRQLPVGVVTAAIGVPLFLYLLNRSR
ncbi:MAG TPA: iron ABC transporter permease [Gammaproteobacteria bacterium]|nr:iron ABC transporter permease [Gammaproteobacteria bacterium]